MRTLLEQLYARSVWLIMRSDADVAISAIRKGYSRKLSYLRRTQKISLGFLHDYTQAPKSPAAAWRPSRQAWSTGEGVKAMRVA